MLVLVVNQDEKTAIVVVERIGVNRPLLTLVIYASETSLNLRFGPVLNQGKDVPAGDPVIGTFDTGGCELFLDHQLLHR
ncbi:MAG: hypothetical protein V3U29_01195, partial [Phycisphaeraceae bacterium]